TLHGPLTWSSGTIQGTLVNPAGSVLALVGSATKTLQGGGPLTTINNAGTVVWSGTGAFNINAPFNNQAGGTFLIQTDATLGGGGTFPTQAGPPFTKSAGTGTNTINTPFPNAGLVRVQTGTLSFASDVTASGTGNTFEATAGAGVDFTGNVIRNFTDTT